MQKLGAVRKNLFNTTVDRDELQKHAEQLDNEGRQALRSYKCDSIIGVIQSATEDQARKLKRLPSRLLDSSSDDESDDGSQRAITTTTEFPSNDEASSSGDHSTQASASKKANLELVQLQIPLPKGQKTIKRETFLQSIFSTYVLNIQFPF